MNATAEVEAKPWGTTRCITRTPTFEMHELAIRAGGFCSIHFHREKHQYIFVSSGILRMRLFDQAGRLREEIDIEPGDAIVNDLNERHQFHAITDVLAFEVYQNPQSVDPADIVRLSEGGCRA